MKKLYLIIFCAIFAQSLKAQYISEVLEYKPAPGQFINSAPWGMPETDNPDVSIVGRLTGAMSLGGFGGYVVFKFENPVENHPDNPYGIDFVIYGNPLVNVARPEINNNVTWSEPGVVSVMKDENNNGLPDDTWYELAGSEYFFSTTVKNYSITYTNPNIDSATDIDWSDNQGNSGKVLMNNFHKQPYYPENKSFANVDPVSYTLNGTKIQSTVDKSNSSYVTSFGRPWGYVDNNLRSIYNGFPDNPYTDGIEENSGGDAFDIRWAINENDEYVDLDKIDFVKVQTGVQADAGWLGEVSTEVTGAFDVAADNTITGIDDMIIIKELPKKITGNSHTIEAFAYKSGRMQKDVILNWTTDQEGISVSDNILTFNISGEVTLTASLPDNPDITATVKTILEYNTSNSLYDTEIQNISLFPNPASENICINGAENADLLIYSVSGVKMAQISGYMNNQISISDYPQGIYFIKIIKNKVSKNIKFIKR